MVASALTTAVVAMGSPSPSLVKSTRAEPDSAQSQVQAAEIAFDGVRRELDAGQRGTFELLTIQQELLNARNALAAAQREHVVSSYTLLAAVGRLSPQILGLPTEMYDPSEHYHQVPGFLGRDSHSGWSLTKDLRSQACHSAAAFRPPR